MSLTVQTRNRQSGQTNPVQPNHSRRDKESDSRIKQASQKTLKSTGQTHHIRKQTTPHRSFKKDSPISLTISSEEALKLLSKPDSPHPSPMSVDIHVVAAKAAIG